MQSNDLFEEYRLGARDILDRLARHGVRQKSDEITGMAGLECHADFAVSLEAADARTVTGAGVDDDKRPPLHDRLRYLGWDDPHEYVVDRPIERPAIDHEFHLVLKHMRSRLGQMLAILVAALPHDIPEQYASLSRIESCNP